MEMFMNHIKVELESNHYDVVIGVLEKLFFDTDILLVTSHNIKELFLDSVLANINAKNVHLCILKDGECHKNMESIQEILKSAFEAKLNRKSLMIALGGGVITDMVGFASGIYQRGIDFISIPTTLLAMVDASVGGKCGINNQYGKNLIGLFHQPKRVYVDSQFLQTLPQRELNAGLAEIIKIFACFDYASLKDFNLSKLKSYIYKSIELKAKVVKEDEKENNGIRMLLNYGHTFGHAIELESDFKEFLHGEAVSMGIVMANKLAVKLGILQQEIATFIESLFQQCNLPTSYKIKNITSFYESFFLDKKSLAQKLHFVLLHSNGVIQAKVHNDIPKDIIIEVLHEFL